MDLLTADQRSRLMSRVRSKDTRPELLVRRLVYNMGFRYRLHRADLPGHPDLVFSKKRRIVFVHGCFWHRHKGCKLASSPKTRTEFWENKFSSNLARDERVHSELLALGWKMLVVWECETRHPLELAEKLLEFLADECQEYSGFSRHRGALLLRREAR
jgi:DNA mismatch endonuclease (patch repair protein)